MSNYIREYDHNGQKTFLINEIPEYNQLLAINNVLQRSIDLVLCQLVDYTNKRDPIPFSEILSNPKHQYYRLVKSLNNYQNIKNKSFEFKIAYIIDNLCTFNQDGEYYLIYDKKYFSAGDDIILLNNDLNMISTEINALYDVVSDLDRQVIDYATNINKLRAGWYSSLYGIKCPFVPVLEILKKIIHIKLLIV